MLLEHNRWWRELNIVSKLPYARDRMVECYYWALGFFCEPEYSRSRIFLAKTIVIVSITDDTYDAYGTPDELQIFTDALQRYTPLPECVELSHINLCRVKIFL
jgi:hypothetical protein